MLSSATRFLEPVNGYRIKASMGNRGGCYRSIPAHEKVCQLASLENVVLRVVSLNPFPICWSKACVNVCTVRMHFAHMHTYTLSDCPLSFGQVYWVFALESQHEVGRPFVCFSCCLLWEGILDTLLEFILLTLCDIGLNWDTLVALFCTDNSNDTRKSCLCGRCFVPLVCMQHVQRDES